MKKSILKVLTPFFLLTLLFGCNIAGGPEERQNVFGNDTRSVSSLSAIYVQDEYGWKSVELFWRCFINEYQKCYIYEAMYNSSKELSEQNYSYTGYAYENDKYYKYNTLLLRGSKYVYKIQRDNQILYSNILIIP